MACHIVSVGRNWIKVKKFQLDVESELRNEWCALKAHSQLKVF